MPKKTNDEFDLTEFDDLLNRKSETSKLEFDVFNLSLDDILAAPAAKTKDDLDLDSFLKFYDEPAAPAPEEEPADELAVPVEASAAEEAEAAAEEPQPEEAAEDTALPVAEKELPAETPEDAAWEEEEEDRPRFSLRSLFRRGEELSEEDEEALLEDEEEEESPRFSLASLFRRKEEALEEDEAAEEDTEAQELPASEAKISFFSKLSPEREKFLSALQAKNKKSEQSQPQSESEGKALQKTAPAAVSANVWQSVPRQPKGGELLVFDSELDEIDYIDDDDLPEMRDYMPIRFSRHSRSGIGGGLMYALFIISVSIILACAGWLFASDVLALNKPDTTSIVTIHPYVPTEEDTLNEDGDAVDEEGRVITVNIDQVASALKSGGVIEYKWLFKLFSELASADVKIDPGTYDVSAKLDYRALVTEMQTGSDSQEITRITFPEGYTMEQIFTLLEDNGICDKDELYDVAANYDFSYEWLDGLELGDPNRLEGYLFPDTYDFYQGESAVNAIDRFLNRFHYILTLDMYKQAENLGITLHEAVIIASLIEEEAGAEDDRSLFASVIYNRLDDGWKLQLDSTVNYVMGTSTLDISIANTEIDHPYNTYVYEGLPPGPISNPGKASLEAALNPASTNYWFWYAYEGKTTFFTSASAFNEFAAAHPY